MTTAEVVNVSFRGRRTRVTAIVSAFALMLALGAAVTVPGSASAATPPKVGIVCTDPTPGQGTEQIFDLTTKTGYISLPDGNTAFMWGYSAGFDDFQHPGPTLCVTEGDTVTVILHNTLPTRTSIAFPGQNDVLANGVPVQREPATDSMVDTAAADDGTITYSFVADHPGTFLYESGTDAEMQVRMGLFGALIVRPAMGDNFAYNRADSEFNTSQEFMVLLSEIDPYLNRAVELDKNFNMNRYHPRYWLINGRGFPDSIADNGASWLPSQPYGALADITPFQNGDQPALARYLNVGTEDYPFHPHGNNGLVIGRDGHPLENESGGDLSFEKFAINIGPGQTWDVRFRWYDAEGYGPDNPVNVTIPSLANQEIGVFYSGSPYLGTQEELPPGIQSVNQCGEYYIISHNHALYQITSWGVNMTGPITYMKIEPPQPNTCG